MTVKVPGTAGEGTKPLVSEDHRRMRDRGGEKRVPTPQGFRELLEVGLPAARIYAEANPVVNT